MSNQMIVISIIVAQLTFVEYCNDGLPLSEPNYRSTKLRYRVTRLDPGPESAKNAIRQIDLFDGTI